MAVISKNEMLDSLLESAEKMMVSGDRPAWQRPWQPRYGESSAPHNPTSGKAYSPLNTMILTVAALEHGYEDPRWMGFNQAKESGYSVRKGEKAGAHIFSPIIKTILDEQTGQEVTRPVGYRATPLFNAAQIDGIPPLKVVPESERLSKSRELDAIAAQMGVAIVHAAQDRAFYSTTQDRINLPMRDQFQDQHGYDATKAHELAHATGHASRLDRNSLKTYAQLESRAAEEVAAEIGSYLTSLHLGIPFTGNSPDLTEEQHAAYVASWGKNLTQDARRQAVDNGLKAAAYLEKQLDLAMENGLLQEQKGVETELVDRELLAYLKKRIQITDPQQATTFTQEQAQKDPDKAAEWAEKLRGDQHGYAKALSRDDVEGDMMIGLATALENAVAKEQQKILDKEDRKVREYWESVKYVVQNEHTLGYILPEQENAPAMLGVLQGDILNGGPDRMRGMVLLEPEHLRRATEKDFERFRVQLPPDFQRTLEQVNGLAVEKAVRSGEMLRGQRIVVRDALHEALEADGWDFMPEKSSYGNITFLMDKDPDKGPGHLLGKNHYKVALEAVRVPGGFIIDRGTEWVDVPVSPGVTPAEAVEALDKAAWQQMLVEHGEEMWGAEKVRALLAEADVQQRNGDLQKIPDTVLPFLGGDQLAVTREGLGGEEKAFFSDKMRELETIIQQMPETYGTDGKPDHEKPVSLRYFGPGNSQWFILEKDRGDPANNDLGQKQAFGLADLGQGFPEMGYINIEEITRHGAEMDYHFAPTNLLEIKKTHYPEMLPAPEQPSLEPDYPDDGSEIGF